MKAIKQRLRSKTYYLGLVIMVLGYLEQNAALLKTMLGDYYGLFVMGVGVAVLVLREITKEPIDAK